MRLSLAQCWSLLTAAERGVLSTLNDHETIDAVPVCFAVVGQSIVSPVDRIKPKETVDLARVRNARHTGTATLLCDHWDPGDWSQLWWVRAHLVLRRDPGAGAEPTTAFEGALRQKYRQYRDTNFAHVLVFDVERLLGWTAAPADDGGGARSGQLAPK